MLLKTAVDCFEEGYFSTCRRSEKTQRAYRVDLDQFRRFAGSRVHLERVQPELLESWADSLRREGYASSSIRRKFAALKVFYGYWVRKGTLDASPLWRIRLDLEREKRLPTYLSAEETMSLVSQVQRELDDIPPKDSENGHNLGQRFLALRNRAIVETLFATGLRVGELTSLRLEDVQLSEYTLKVRGKGGRQRIAMLPDPRSREALMAYYKSRISCQATHQQLLLNVFRGPLSTQGVAVMLRRVAKAAGIFTPVTPHVLRHTIATLLLDEGADLRTVQEFLGHQSIATTQRYTHVSKEKMASRLAKYHPNMGLTSV